MNHPYHCQPSSEEILEEDYNHQVKIELGSFTDEDFQEFLTEELCHTTYKGKLYHIYIRECLEKNNEAEAGDALQVAWTNYRDTIAEERAKEKVYG